MSKPKMVPASAMDDGPHFSIESGPLEHRAWEEVEAGRFMPRRVRGSFPGRALG